MDNEDKPPATPQKSLSSRQTYNIVSDIIFGINIRKDDNINQAKMIGIFFFSGLMTGYFVTGGGLLESKRLGNACMCGLIGLIAGVLLSGIFLMIYRAIMHAMGKHD